MIEGAVFLASFFYFPFVALYDEINSVSFLFSAIVVLYDYIIKVSLAPSLYALFFIFASVTLKINNLLEIPAGYRQWRFFYFSIDSLVHQYAQINRL